MEIKVSYSLLICVRIEFICFHTVIKVLTQWGSINNLIFSQDETNSLFFCSVQADPDGAGFDLDLPPIDITIGTIPHKVAFPNFEAAPTTDDGGPSEDGNSRIVPLSEELQEKFPKIPGVLRGKGLMGLKLKRTRKVPYMEYSANK